MEHTVEKRKVHEEKERLRKWQSEEERLRKPETRNGEH